MAYYMKGIAPETDIWTDIFYGYPQSLQSYTRIISQIRLWRLSTSSSVQYTIIIDPGTHPASYTIYIGSISHGGQGI
jgi:hypothetical protein